MTTSATITRTLTDTTARESTSATTSYAYAHYQLSQPLTSATQVNVSMSGSGGATAADFVSGTFQYRIGSGPWITTSTNGPITLNAGHSTFDLRVELADDALAETGEGVTFVVSQTAATVGITDSYWVPAQVDILDPVGEGASAFARTILASSTVAGVEGSTNAKAIYSINGDNSGNYAAAEVKVSVTTGLGGSSTADYTTLYYNVGTGDTAFTNNGLITIPATVTSFSLSASIPSDGLAESGEQLLFTVSQTANSIGLVNSWSVQSIVDLNDPADAGANVHTRTITAGATQTGVEGTVTPAMATYDMAYGLLGGGYAADVVKVGIMTGLGGSSTADYQNFSYSLDGTTWATVDANGLVTIPASSTAELHLRADVVSDQLAEAGEQLVFTVSQTAVGPSLTNSWWVPSTVNIRDADGTGATAISRTIVADSTVTGIEDSTTSRAQANYAFLDSATGTGYADAQVKVGIVTGLGGSSTADYENFKYSLDGSNWSSVPTNGLVTILSTATQLSLRADVKSDQISESSEQLMFTVSNTGSSPAITDSWWVPNVVNLQDAVGTGAVAYARHIAVGATTTGMEGADNWTTNTAPAIATFNVTYDGGGTVINYGATEVHVSMFGAGGASAVDYSGFMYRMGTSGSWLPVLSDGLITIPASSTSFQLASLALTDSISETGEGITFAVSQTANSIGLVDSWWVANTADLADVAAVYTVMTGGVGSDIFTGTSAREMFTIPAGTSLIQTLSADSFDIINGFAANGATAPDLIDLPITVTGVLNQLPNTAAGIILALGSTIPSLFTGGNVAIYPVTGTGGADVFVAIDSNANDDWDPATDTVIKLAGITDGPLTTADFG